jgi:hypothetical protein
MKDLSAILASKKKSSPTQPIHIKPNFFSHPFSTSHFKIDLLRVCRAGDSTSQRIIASPNFASHSLNGLRNRYTIASGLLAGDTPQIQSPSLLLSTKTCRMKKMVRKPALSGSLAVSTLICDGTPVQQSSFLFYNEDLWRNFVHHERTSELRNISETVI